MKPAIFFDIDGTLLYAKGLGRAAFAEAFEVAYRHPVDMSNVSFVGATDTAIIRTLAHAQGIVSTPAQEEQFFFAFAQALDVRLKEGPILLYPGVQELLARLVERGYLLGTVTGNIRTTAWRKLHHSGLDTYFTFGAYACDHEDRNQLAAIAMQRAEALGASAKLLIGDTPKDIHAAHANKLPCLAVATGWISEEELSAAGANAVLKDFSNVDATLSLIDELCHE